MKALIPLRTEQLRLGWLAVLVNLVGDASVSLKDTALALSQVEGRFEEWWQKSELVRPPKGGVPPKRRDQVVRMLCTYGLYEPTWERLSELGLILRHFRPDVLRPTGSPFQWEGAASWLGLWIVVQSGADIILPLIRAWTEDTLDITALAKRLSSLLLALRDRTRDPDLHKTLLMQANRQDQEDSGAKLVQPYLEPLRELGLVKLQKGPRGQSVYGLTERGQRLRTLLQGTTVEQKLIDSPFPKLALQAIEPEWALRPASRSELRAVLKAIPQSMTRADGQELSVATLIAFGQTYLIQHAPGAWLDFSVLQDLVEQLSRRTEARLTFKSGLSISELNLAWTEPQVLDTDSYWATETANQLDWTSSNTTEPEAVLESEGIVPAVSSGAVEESAPPEPPEHAAAAEYGFDSPTSPAPLPMTILEGASDAVEAPGPVPPLVPGPKPSVASTPAQQQRWPFGFRVSPHQRIWLQHVQSLLHDAQGRPISQAQDGPSVVGLPVLERDVQFALQRGLIGHLRHLYVLTSIPANHLSPKRKAQGNAPSTALLAIKEITDACASRHRGNGPSLDLLSTRLGHLMKAWGDEHYSPDEVAGILVLLLEERAALLEPLVNFIKAFLFSNSSSPASTLEWERWPSVERLTRSLFLDLLELGLLVPSDLTGFDQAPQQDEEVVRLVNEWLELLDRLSNKSIHLKQFEFQYTINEENDSVSSSPEFTLPLFPDGHGIDQHVFQRHQSRSDTTPNSSNEVLEEFSPRQKQVTSSAPAKGKGIVWALTKSQAERLAKTYVPRMFLMDKPPKTKWLSFSEESTSEEESPGELDLGKDEIIRPLLPGVGEMSPSRLRIPFGPQATTLLAKPASLQERIMRAMQLLDRAEQPEMRPSEALSQSWTALEQLVSVSTAEKGPRTISAVVAGLTLLHFRDNTLQLYRDVRYALSTSYVFDSSGGSGTPDPQLMDRWLHHPSRQDLMAARNAQLEGWLAGENGLANNPFYGMSPNPSLDAQTALQTFIEGRDTASSVQDLLTFTYPLVSYRMTLLYGLLGLKVQKATTNSKSSEKTGPTTAERLAALERLQRRFEAFLWFCYELRNQFMHEAFVFHEEDDPRLRGYARHLSALARAFVALVERRSAKHPGMKPENLWGILKHLQEQLHTLPLDALPALFATL